MGHLYLIMEPFHFVLISVSAVPFLQVGSSWFFLIVESAPCGWGWTNGLSRFPGWRTCVCVLVGGSGSLWSAMNCPVLSLWVWHGFCASHLLMFRVVFLFCWRISLVCLALDLDGPWVELSLVLSWRPLEGALAY